MRKYPFWLKLASVLQLIAALIHAITLFVSLPPSNGIELQLNSLMDSYRFDLGAGFHRTMGELNLVLSACFCLVCMFGSLVNWFLIRQNAAQKIIHGVILINLFIFGILFGLTVAFTFLLPIILLGLIFLSLVAANITERKSLSSSR